MQHRSRQARVGAQDAEQHLSLQCRKREEGQGCQQRGEQEAVALAAAPAAGGGSGAPRGDASYSGAPLAFPALAFSWGMLMVILNLVCACSGAAILPAARRELGRAPSASLSRLQATADDLRSASALYE